MQVQAQAWATILPLPCRACRSLARRTGRGARGLARRGSTRPSWRILKPTCRSSTSATACTCLKGEGPSLGRAQLSLWPQTALSALPRGFLFLISTVGGGLACCRWFNETLPAADIRRIAFLRLDGDLFSSTWDALQVGHYKECGVVHFCCPY